MLMRRVCAWCGSLLPSKECQCSGPTSIDEPISHSICPECLEKALAEIESAPAETIKPNK